MQPFPIAWYNEYFDRALIISQKTYRGKGAVDWIAWRLATCWNIGRWSSASLSPFKKGSWHSDKYRWLWHGADLVDPHDRHQERKEGTVEEHLRRCQLYLTTCRFKVEVAERKGSEEAPSSYVGSSFVGSQDPADPCAQCNGANRMPLRAEFRLGFRLSDKSLGGSLPESCPGQLFGYMMATGDEVHYKWMKEAMKMVSTYQQALERGPNHPSGRRRTGR